MGIVLWTGGAGALLGWIAGDYDGLGLVTGGFFGALLGLWLRSAVRREIAGAVRAALSDAAYQVTPTPAAAVAAELASRDLTEPVAAEPAEPEPSFPDSPGAFQPEPWAEPLDAPAYGYSAAVPNPFEELLARARNWLLGGNTIVRVGLAVLFLGLVFLARFAAMSGLFPIEARLAAVAAAGIALLAVGLKKRTERREFALSLQGAGVAVLYLVVFAAAKAYGVMPPAAAFAFMILFAALGCALAVMEDSLAMAFASFLGGFAVPVLLGGESETPLGLFSYLTILNLAILFIAWKKSWRALNLLGFGATFGLATAWGFTAYEDQHYLLCQVFLAVSVAIYLSTAVLYAHNTPGKLGNYADSTLLFGTALAGFGLQIGLVHDRPFASAWSALAFGAAYIAVTALTTRRKQPEMRLLNECLLAIGVGFVTLAVPLALEVKWTSPVWALEGAGAFWVGARQARWMPRCFGLALQALAAVLALEAMQPNISAIPLLNNGFMLPVMVALPMLHTAWLMRAPLEHSGSRWARSYARAEHGLSQFWFLGGFLLACVAVLREVGRMVPAVTMDIPPAPALSYWMQIYAAMLAILGAMALAEWFGKRRDWPVAGWPARVALPWTALCFLLVLIYGRHVFYWPDLACWAVTAALYSWLLRRQPVTAWTHALHVGTVLLLTALVADGVWLGIELGELWNTSWAGVTFLVSATAMLMTLTHWAGKAAGGQATGLAWPLAPYARAYWWHGALVLALLVYGGTMASVLLAEGVADPLPYIPVLNPVDLSAMLALAALVLWRRMLAAVRTHTPLMAWLAGRGGLAALAMLGFVLANTIWLRSAHHLLGIGWDAATLARSQIVQSGYSLLWTLIATGLMFFARKRIERLPWLTGAVLLAVVVAKLVLMDMSKVDGLARIVAFIGVGVLMLLIGYFVPMPPRRELAEARA